MATIKLYHGTATKTAQVIKDTGYIYGPVYLVGNAIAAGDYGPEILEVEVEEHELMIDFDLPGGKLLTVEEANVYDDHDGWTIMDYIENGYAVATENDVKV